MPHKHQEIAVSIGRMAPQPDIVKVSEWYITMYHHNTYFLAQERIDSPKLVVLWPPGAKD